MSALQKNTAALFVALVCVLAAFATIQIASAQVNAGAGANATCVAKCTADAAQAKEQNNQSLNCVGLGGAKAETCQYSGPGGVVNGQCLVGMVCQAETANGKGVDTGLQQLGQILGQLLSKLGQSSGSGSGSSSPTPTSASTACTSYTPTSDPTQIGVNPCVYYVPSAASQLTTTGTTGSNTSAQDLLNSLTGNTGTPTSIANTDTLTATPNSGAAPLSVTFSTTPSATDVSPFTINFGDGSSPQPIAQAACTASIPASCSYQATYAYAAAGTFTAQLVDANGNILASATVTIQNPGGGTASSSVLTQVFNSVGGLFSGSSTPAPSGQGSPNFPGVLGNILLDQNGATIYAATVNSANNSESSGFYGSDTLGSQPQGVASQLCQGRPWASNFLADIIPPSFFDSLCQWGGYQVGTPPAPTQPQVTLTQQAQTSAPASQTVAPTPAASTTPAVPAQATIWAVPSSVPLGARTSIFWNTQGVTSCTETSPDGSFSESSLSGAAATVPIISATTFTISCVDPNGNPITDYVTVSISN